ncbi:MAG: hypothetical protein QOJ50_2360 [Cryptosporangiaceae bacterium]|nr:hypothetical protein [Cryptosporangiaceae bacterium]
MSQRRGPDDGAPPPGDGDPAGLPPPWSEFVVPDDPRELAAEAAEVRAELAKDARRRRRRALLRPGLSLPFVALLLLLVAALSSLIIVMTPATRRPPDAAPQATPTGEPGTVGALLPDLALKDGAGRPVGLRQTRPAALLLMPDGCGCDRTAAELVLASRSSLVTVELVGSEHAPGLPNGSADARVLTLADPEKGLSAALAGPGPVQPETTPTAVLVRADGVIADIVHNPEHPRDLADALAHLSG